jgi:hypothetical protein
VKKKKKKGFGAHLQIPHLLQIGFALLEHQQTTLVEEARKCGFGMKRTTSKNGKKIDLLKQKDPCCTREA